MENAERRFHDSLKVAEIRFFIASLGSFTFASRALAVAIGFQIYRLTRDPLALGWLGLIEAIPAISLVFFGGYAADHFNRQKILFITRSFSCLAGAGLAFLSWQNGPNLLAGLYTMIFLVGVARGFADPAGAAFEAQIVPQHLTVNASSWISSVWLISAVLGPAAIGFIFDAWGAVGAYLVITAGFLFSCLFLAFISPKPQAPVERHESVFKSIGMGWHFVMKCQPLLAAMALDLLAVLFGGAVALLPVYAEDILHVGAKGLGILNAATFFGAMTISLMATHRPPIARAGRNLLLVVAGFGLCILVFAFSRNFWLSLAALFLSGMFDGVSVVIRRSMVRLLSPNHLRGRIAAANMVFIVSSNEIGAFESGFLASLIGPVPCVAVGGLVTLGVAALTAALAPQLRSLRFNPRTLEHLKPSSN